MIALGATIIVRGPRGERRVEAQEFFTGIYETTLTPQELLVAVELPVAAKDGVRFFQEFARRHGDYAIVGLAAHAIVKNGRFADLRLGFFAVGDRPLLAKAAGKFINIDDGRGGCGGGERGQRRPPAVRYHNYRDSFDASGYPDGPEANLNGDAAGKTKYNKSKQKKL
jgi:hypothetical protein